MRDPIYRVTEAAEPVYPLPPFVVVGQSTPYAAALRTVEHWQGYNNISRPRGEDFTVHVRVECLNDQSVSNWTVVVRWVATYRADLT